MKFLIVIAFLLSFCQINFAQVDSVGVINSSLGLHQSTYDSRILIHYTKEELEDFAANNPEKLAVLSYYFTASFILEAEACTDCLPFDPSQFDISKFEHLRQKSVRVEIDQAKYGIKIILLAADELEYLTPLQNFRFY